MPTETTSEHQVLWNAYNNVAARWIGGQTWGLEAKAVAHGAVSGTASVAQGGKFGQGFASSFFTKMVVSNPIQGCPQ